MMRRGMLLLPVLLLLSGCVSAQVSNLGPWPVSAEKSDGHALFSFVETEDQLTLYDKVLPLLTYNHGMQLAEGAPEDRKRACYIHPLYNLEGVPLTDDWQPDHWHHRGVAWMWPGVLIGERRVDQWHIKGVRQHFVRWLGREKGPAFAIFGVESGWFLEDEPLSKGKQAAREECWYRVHAYDRGAYAIDVHYTLKALEEPITLWGQTHEEKGYGGFALRMRHPVHEGVPVRDRITITAATGGEVPGSVDLGPSPWADYSARFGENELWSGVAVFQHPENPGFPGGWTLRYYGFLGVAWPGSERYTIEAGESLVLQYRMWVHEGSAAEAEVERAWREYAEE